MPIPQPWKSGSRSAYDRRWRLDRNRWRSASKCRVPVAVNDVEEQTDKQPPSKPHPRQVRETPHYENAKNRADHTDKVDEGHPERAFPFAIGMAQHNHPGAHEREREKRPDVSEVVRLTSIPN